MCKVRDCINQSDDEGQMDYRVCFCQCPGCSYPMLALQTQTWGDEEWDPPERVWPAKKSIDWQVPGRIRESLEEAQTCLDSKAYVAAALMCRRTLEAFCKHHNAEGKTLYQKIEHLYQAEKIDERLNSWAEALREDGNLAAHDPGAIFTRDNASDLVDFTRAFVDYAFVLTAKFDQFKARRAKVKPKVPPLPRRAPQAVVTDPAALAMNDDGSLPRST